MQVLRTIIIIILVYYAIKLFARYVLPLMAKYFIRRSVKNFEKQFHPEDKPSGEMNIKHSPEKKQNLDDLGEYIDYEEINDDNNK